MVTTKQSHTHTHTHKCSYAVHVWSARRHQPPASARAPLHMQPLRLTRSGTLPRGPVLAGRRISRERSEELPGRGRETGEMGDGAAGVVAPREGGRRDGERRGQERRRVAAGDRAVERSGRGGRRRLSREAALVKGRRDENTRGEQTRAEGAESEGVGEETTRSTPTAEAGVGRVSGGRDADKGQAEAEGRRSSAREDALAGGHQQEGRGWGRKGGDGRGQGEVEGSQGKRWRGNRRSAKVMWAKRRDKIRRRRELAKGQHQREGGGPPRRLSDGVGQGGQQRPEPHEPARESRRRRKT